MVNVQQWSTEQQYFVTMCHRLKNKTSIGTILPVLAIEPKSCSRVTVPRCNPSYWKTSTIPRAFIAKFWTYKTLQNHQLGTAHAILNKSRSSPNNPATRFVDGQTWLATSGLHVISHLWWRLKLKYARLMSLVGGMYHETTFNRSEFSSLSKKVWTPRGMLPLPCHTPWILLSLQGRILGNATAKSRPTCALNGVRLTYL